MLDGVPLYSASPPGPMTPSPCVHNDAACGKEGDAIPHYEGVGTCKLKPCHVTVSPRSTS
eukprot:scaffold208076_cov38-Prasinocladus_malaysianus.AAC.1